MKKLLLTLVIVPVLLLSSCTVTLTNQADEIRLNRWTAALGGNRSVSLSFDEDIGCLQISDKEKNTARIQGLAVIDKNEIALFDSEDKVYFRFKYSLKENKLKLKTSDGTLTLKRN